jgi:hypothetical protein
MPKGKFWIGKSESAGTATHEVRVGSLALRLIVGLLFRLSVSKNRDTFGGVTIAGEE